MHARKTWVERSCKRLHTLNREVSLLQGLCEPPSQSPPLERPPPNPCEAGRVSLKHRPSWEDAEKHTCGAQISERLFEKEIGILKGEPCLRAGGNFRWHLPGKAWIKAGHPQRQQVTRGIAADPAERGSHGNVLITLGVLLSSATDTATCTSTHNLQLGKEQRNVTEIWKPESSCEETEHFDYTADTLREAGAAATQN